MKRALGDFGRYIGRGYRGWVGAGAEHPNCNGCRLFPFCMLKAGPAVPDASQGERDATQAASSPDAAAGMAFKGPVEADSLKAPQAQHEANNVEPAPAPKPTLPASPEKPKALPTSPKPAHSAGPPNPVRKIATPQQVPTAIKAASPVAPPHPAKAPVLTAVKVEPEPAPRQTAPPVPTESPEAAMLRAALSKIKDLESRLAAQSSKSNAGTSQASTPRTPPERMRQPIIRSSSTKTLPDLPPAEDKNASGGEDMVAMPDGTKVHACRQQPD